MKAKQQRYQVPISHRDCGTCKCFWRNLNLISMLCSESKTSVPILPISHHRPQLSRKVFIPLPDEDPETSVEMVVPTLSRIFLLSMERTENRFQGAEKGWHQWWVAWNFSTCHCRVECSDRMSERNYATLCVVFVAGCAPAWRKQHFLEMWVR